VTRHAPHDAEIARAAQGTFSIAQLGRDASFFLGLYAFLMADFGWFGVPWSQNG
jgi:hypothetical protein